MNQPEITRIIGQMILNKEPDEKILRTLIELSIDPNTAQQLITASRKSQGGSARVVSSRKALVIETYEIESDGVKLEVSVIQTPDDFVLHYYLNFPEYGEGTKALLANLKRAIISEASFKTDKLLDPKFVVSLKERFRAQAEATLRKENTKLDETTKQVLVADLIHEMLGLGKIEFLLSDGNLEEIVVNSAKDPAWVYSKKYGWLKTNVQIATEDEIQNYASIIARRVGKQVTVLNPLLDAHLITGDRANATLFPISSAGNTITIRRFRRDPWTVTDFIKTGTVNAEIMALMWLAMQYELNIIISGGTASGKTSLMNVLVPFIQPNQRIITIEDTRELSLPGFLHWVPMTTREPNPEGKGGVSMLDLLVNSLRMRPDRIIVGETRRQVEAEVMFEGMHTGHSVYTTFHANTAEETIRRMTNPPISIPMTMMDAVHLNIVQFRNRRLGVRRVLQIAEFLPEKRGNEDFLRANTLYRWRPSTDTIEKNAESIRLNDELGLHTGLSPQEISQDLKKKQGILNWMVKHNVHEIDRVGRIMAEYYMHEDEILEAVQGDKMPENLLAGKTEDVNE
jgi:flagellar protein FlaI